MAPAEPVLMTLVGSRAAVGRLVAVLDEAVSLSDVSDPMPYGVYDVRVTAIVSRRYPLAGGPR
ncbi:hypothetical protein [Catellatospora chokoriensis]|nr:hypothetical protein [Catellatospora chokoriensis]